MEEIGTYQITGIAYLDGSGAEQMILFAEKGITASFQVVQDEALFVPESGAQVETYSMNEGKQMVQAGAETAEAAISETLDEAGVTEAAVLSARSGERREVVVAIGAGHDANAMAHEGVPIGMIFVPSVKGISHQGDEYTNRNISIWGRMFCIRLC